MYGFAPLEEFPDYNELCYHFFDVLPIKIVSSKNKYSRRSYL